MLSVGNALYIFPRKFVFVLFFLINNCGNVYKCVYIYVYISLITIPSKQLKVPKDRFMATKLIQILTDLFLFCSTESLSSEDEGEFISRTESMEKLTLNM